MGGALSGFRVVEIATGLAVAYCGQLFVRCGAEVIRVEPPAGDEVRRSGPFPDDVPDLQAGGLHRVLNGGKRSVVLDVDDEADAQATSTLIRSCDLLLSSWRKPSKLSLDNPEAVARSFPGVVYLSISPFGRTGPYADYEADTLVVEALSGMSYVSGDPEREPLGIGVPLADYMAGATGFLSGIAALADQMKGGEHHFVDVSALDALAICDDYSLALYLGSGAIRKRHYSRVVVSYPSGMYECADGYIAFTEGIRGGGDFATAIATLVERPELASEPMLLQPKERVLQWRKFDEWVVPWFRTHTVDEVIRRGREAGFALQRVPDMSQLMRDQHLRARGFFETLPDGGITIGPPFRMSATPLASLPLPRLGADNELLVEAVARAARSEA